MKQVRLRDFPIFDQSSHLTKVMTTMAAKATSLMMTISLFSGAMGFVSYRIRSSPTLLKHFGNAYDDFRSDGVADVTVLDEENVLDCLEEFIESDNGKNMFGCHELPRSVGITGKISFVELEGPEVILSLEGEFWHKRSTVLGRAAVWLNARMPERNTPNVMFSEVPSPLELASVRPCWSRRA